ncbi:MAG: DUF1904 family protein [Clostridium sp.]
MPMIKIKGIGENEVIKKSTILIDELVDIVGCPRDYFSIELVNSTFIMDGKIVDAPTMIDVLWFERGQEVQNKVAKCITNHFKEDRECLDVVFYALDTTRYYENGEHF